MKNVKQFFHKVGTDKQKIDFIFEFIMNLIKQTSIRPRVVIFFNENNKLESFFEEIKNDDRFKDYIDQFATYHGEMGIKVRNDVRSKFDNCRLNFLLTTNLLARRIDFYEVTCVINCDIPLELKKRGKEVNGPITEDQIDVKTYFHRIDIAGNSNKKAVAVTLSNLKGEEAIIKQAEARGVIIFMYKDFEEIKDYFEMCFKHNKEQNEQMGKQLADKSWLDIGFSLELSDQLIQQRLNFPKPTQIDCIPRIMKYIPKEEKFYQHVSVFCFANWRDKTLCFLPPMIEKFKSNPKMSKPWQPQAIIVANTKDLCLQIGKQITAIMPPSKQFEISYHFRDTVTKDIKGSICIGTPSYIVMILNRIKTDKLKFLIIDEADEVLYNNTIELQQIMAKIYEDVSEGFQFLLFTEKFEESDYVNLEKIIDDVDFNRSDINIESYL